MSTNLAFRYASVETFFKMIETKNYGLPIFGI